LFEVRQTEDVTSMPAIACASDAKRTRLRLRYQVTRWSSMSSAINQHRTCRGQRLVVRKSDYACTRASDQLQ
jgi:hypothetical protein